MGMQWFKCDLHMHTPADSAHWQDKNMGENDITALADEYARACFETGLDVIGITDHNFLCKEFLFPEDKTGSSQQESPWMKRNLQLAEYL